MITKIEIDGFKSLSNFELQLHPGLNILVGPNGAGKTNIILFFEFLSKIITHPIGLAVSAVGGAGAIFKKIEKDEYQNSISIKIFGSILVNKKKYITYEYIVKINTSFEKDSIYFDYQQIKIKYTTKFWEDPKSNYYPTKWDIDLFFSNPKGDKGNVEVKEFNKKIVDESFFIKKAFDKIGEIIMSNNPAFYSIIPSLYMMDLSNLYKIHIDLVGGETFNIIPSKVKEQEDAASPPGIKKDGSGLATTLYALKKSKSRIGPRIRFILDFDEQRIQYDPKIFEKIVTYARLANKTIENIDVENDPFDNKLVVKINIATGNYSAILPLSAMSDGTIKWVTLITAILTSKTIFSIEEPENFLHPWMQAEIVKIMREHLSQKRNNSCIIMTTHSESLINYSRPEEIILVDQSKGKTVAHRVNNLESLKNEISMTGFGLGYYYFTNALENE